MSLKLLKCPEGSFHVPPIWALSLLGALKWECHLREGQGGKPAEPIVCVSSLGLELLQGRSQDPRFPEGGRKARVGRRGKGKARWTQHLGHPQTLSVLRAETVFADRKLKPAEPPSPLLYTGRGQAWRTALDTWGEVLVPTMEPDLSGGCKLFYRGPEDQCSCRAGHTGSVMTTQGYCQTRQPWAWLCAQLYL